MTKKVVVIGGGFAGAYITKKLERQFDVTLIDEKDYFEFTPGILRAIVEPEHLRKIQVLHSHYTKRADIVHGCAGEITEQHVRVGHKNYPYDYLVITSGFRYGLPFKPEDVIISTRASEMRNNKKRLEAAKRVLIIGGGLSGVELVGEILDKYQKKEIIMVHKSSCLIPRNSEPCKTYVTKLFQKKGVMMHFNEEVRQIRGKTYTTDKNRKINADIAFLCTGIKPNIEALKKSFPELITRRNQIIVNEHLHIKERPNIFAGGDITDIKEEKTAQNAEKHAKIIVENIIRMEKGKSLIAYESKKRPMIISLGKYNGMLAYKNFAMRGLIPAFLKWFVEWRTMTRYRKVA